MTLISLLKVVFLFTVNDSVNLQEILTRAHSHKYPEIVHGGWRWQEKFWKPSGATFANMCCHIQPSGEDQENVGT